MKPSAKVLKRLTKTIVALAHPKRIILFGSAARGDMGKHSDLDLLVVMPDGTHRRNTAGDIYTGLWDLGYAKDIVVVTESDIVQYASNPYMVIYHALKEGKELYRAA